MKRIFLDTNFLIDFTTRAEFAAVCTEVLTKGEINKMKFFISFLTLANYAYINRKLDKEKLWSDLALFCNIFTVISNVKDNVLQAIQLQAKDFEDALQYQTALSGACDCIITRNTKDFTFSSIPVLTPVQFLHSLK